MAKGLTTVTMPVAADVVYGEFKVYANYECPDQLELGATQGGCKINIERVIREMKMDGTYGPVKGKRRYEKLNAKVTLQSLVLKYMNKVTISDCESDGTWESNDWAGTGGTYAAETTIVNSGDQSAKATIAAVSANFGIKEVFAASKDLTVLNNSEISTTSDYIGWAIYITTQDKTDLGSADIRIAFHMDADLTETNYYYYDVAASTLTADSWTTFKIAKSAFTEAGTGNWAAVTGVSFKVNAGTDAETIFYVDSIDLIQAQTKGTIMPVNGGGASYTDEGDYRSFRPNLTLTESEYYRNIAIVGQKHNGKVFMFLFKDVLNDGAIKIALQEKQEAINETVLTAHYKYGAQTTCPITIRDYDV